MTQPDLKELVAAARRDRPPPRALMAVARRLRVPFVAGGVVLVPSTALGSFATKVGVSRLVLLGWGAGSAVAVTGVMSAVALHEAAPQPAPVVMPRAHFVKHAPARPIVEESRSEPETVEPAPSAERRIVRDDSGIWDEPQLIERARKALATDPRRALALTREHQRRFPTGALTLERDVIAIQALARTGQTAEARRRALAFEARYPQSIHLRQVRALRMRLEAP